MRFQQLSNLGIYNIISLIALGLILLYLSITDYRKLSINGWDLCLMITYTALNSAFRFYVFGIPFLFDGLKAIIFSLLFFLILILITKGNGIGTGDMLFFSIASINLGLKNSFEAITLGFGIGAIICLILILTKKLNMKERVPFIPFLSLGIYLSIFLNFTYL
ncbi:MAG TPA: hypothetical protein PLC43_07075 [Caldisericia bacterium]|nr:hypothetical protein [Caldisericia bacterium]